MERVGRSLTTSYCNVLNGRRPNRLRGNRAKNVNDLANWTGLRVISGGSPPPYEMANNYKWAV